MKYKLFSVFDQAVGAYKNVLQYITIPEAVRAFTMGVEQEGTDLNAHPKDFILYQLGELDCDTGLIVSLPSPQRVCSAYECIKDKSVVDKAVKRSKADLKAAN